MTKICRTERTGSFEHPPKKLLAGWQNVMNGRSMAGESFSAAHKNLAKHFFEKIQREKNKTSQSICTQNSCLTIGKKLSKYSSVTKML